MEWRTVSDELIGVSMSLSHETSQGPMESLCPSIGQARWLTIVA
jgi:hypothetical protein